MRQLERGGSTAVYRNAAIEKREISLLRLRRAFAVKTRQPTVVLVWRGKPGGTLSHGRLGTSLKLCSCCFLSLSFVFFVDLYLMVAYGGSGTLPIYILGAGFTFCVFVFSWHHAGLVKGCWFRSCFVRVCFGFVDRTDQLARVRKRRRFRWLNSCFLGGNFVSDSLLLAPSRFQPPHDWTGLFSLLLIASACEDSRKHNTLHTGEDVAFNRVVWHVLQLFFGSTFWIRFAFLSLPAQPL